MRPIPRPLLVRLMRRRFGLSDSHDGYHGTAVVFSRVDGVPYRRDRAEAGKDDTGVVHRLRRDRNSGC